MENTKQYMIDMGDNMLFSYRKTSVCSKELPIVEIVGDGDEKICIVRWDIKKTVNSTTPLTATFAEAVPNMLQEANVDVMENIGNKRVHKDFKDIKEAFRRNRVSLCKSVVNECYSHSEIQYAGIPDADKVVADIIRDLDAHYKDAPMPEIDLDAYRSAIEKINK